MLSLPFREWAARAKHTVKLSAAEHAVMVANVGGEIRYYIRDGFSLTSAERSESERFMMSSSDLINIERYLAVELADDVRENEGLARLQIPGRMGEYAAGVIAREDNGTVTIVVGDRPPIRFVHGDPYRLQPDVQFSYFATASIPEIVESALSASGGPLFSTS
ncbi:Imm61 family immunity protein [Cryobacterium suzukii]|nr:Imm61 family immunity protein [Cryobacterium suzukii]